MEREIICNYGRVFRRDWRLYSIPDGSGGRRPLPFRNGLPMRALGWFAASLAVMFVLIRVPLLSDVLILLTWPVIYIGLPTITAVTLTQLEPDGRPASRWIITQVAHRLGAPVKSAGRPIRAEGEVAILGSVTAIAAHPSSTDLGRGVVHGPAIITFRDPVAVLSSRRGGRWQVRPEEGFDPSTKGFAGFATDVELDAGERLDVRP